LQIHLQPVAWREDNAHKLLKAELYPENKGTKIVMPGRIANNKDAAGWCARNKNRIKRDARDNNVKTYEEAAGCERRRVRRGRAHGVLHKQHGRR
jgi:hypothetical protein